MNYYFNVIGYYGKCEVDLFLKMIYLEFIKFELDLVVVVVLGVLCGLFIIIVMVFVVLFLFGRIRRKNKKKKGGLVMLL